MNHRLDSMPRRAMLRAATLSALATASIVPTAAHAGYSVQTYANTGRGYLRGCAAQYNIGGTGASFINNAGGGSPCDPAAFKTYQNATVTVSGSTDTTGTLTKANDASSVVAAPDSAFATAAADLKTGTLQLTASAANFAGAIARAAFNDTLHFTVAGASASTVTYIPVSFAFGGTLTDGAVPTYSSAELYWGFAFGNASTYEYGDYGAGYYAPPNYPAFAFPETTPGHTSGWQSYSFASYTPTDTRFSGVYALTGASADVPISFSLGIDANNDLALVTSNGSVGIGQVAGVSYTSDSGVFGTGGTASVGGVPEPASWALMCAGFGIVGTAARRRRVTVSA